MLNLSLTTLLKQVSLFADLDRDEATDVSRRLRPVVFEPGQRVFAQGDASDGMYVIERGEFVVLATRAGTDERVVLAELGPGAILGELSLIDGSPRSATVETLSMGGGYLLSQAAFADLRASGSLAAPKIVLQLARTLEQRKRVTEHRLRGLIDAGDAKASLASRDVRELFGRLLKG